MTLGDVTDPEAVNAAMDEFDRIGSEAFLAKYGFGAATRYLVQRGERLYDSKAIAGVAHGYQHPHLAPTSYGGPACQGAC